MKTIDFLIAADLHYQPSPSGASSALIKQMAYINEIVDAFVDTVVRRKPSALILTGDVTNNGRASEHEALTRRLTPILKAGIRVLVLPGNHDITSATSPYFARQYAAFGFDDALMRDQHSLSYVASPAPGIWWLMLDTNRMGSPEAAILGQLSGETLAWVQSVLERARLEGITVFAAGHHNLLTPSARLYRQMTGHAAVLALLNRYGVPLYASGHRHHHGMIKSGLLECGEGMLADYPNAYGRLGVDAKARRARYDTLRLDVSGWAKRRGIGNPDLARFAGYSRRASMALYRAMAAGAVKALSVPARDAKAVERLLAEAFMAFSDGTIDEKSERFRSLDAYRAFEQSARESGGHRYADIYGTILNYPFGPQRSREIDYSAPASTTGVDL